MPGRRIQKGSFGTHLEELVKHFPHEHSRSPGQLEHIKGQKRDQGDVHALLFEQAWRLNRRNGKSGR